MWKALFVDIKEYNRLVQFIGQLSQSLLSVHWGKCPFIRKKTENCLYLILDLFDEMIETHYTHFFYFNQYLLNLVQYQKKRYISN